MTLIASAKTGGATGGTTAAVDTTGANLLVLVTGGSAAAVSDSKGNTYTAGTLRGQTRTWWCLAPAVDAAHTFTVSGAATSIIAAAFSGTGTPVLDQEGQGSWSGTSVLFGQTLTPSVANCLIISGTSFPNPGYGTYAVGSGWTLVDKLDYVGGTNYGSALVFQTQTTATAIAGTNVTGTLGTSLASETVSEIFKYSAAAGITITTPATKKVHQRIGTTGNIAITGTYTGTPTAIEASFNGGAYQTIVASPTGGTYSGTLTGQAQGQGTVTVRFTNAPATLATVADIGVGEVFIVGGDSISEGRGTNAQSYTHATLKAAKFTQADAWGNGVDGIDTGTSAGSHWPLLATQIMASLGVPVAFISVGTGGTDVAGSNNSWAKPNTEYAGMTSQVTDSGVNSVKACLFHLGPNAVVNASTLSQATYKSALDTLASNINADVAGSPKLNLGIFGQVNTGSPPDRVSALNNLRAAVVQAIDTNANIEPGPCLIDLSYADGVHPSTDAQLATVAARWWLALSQTYYGGASGRGPRLSSASWNVARTVLTVIFDRALKTGLTFSTAPWLVKDAATTMTVSSIAYHGSNANALVLTMSAAAVGAANSTTLTFANGDTASGVVIPMSTDIAMPVGAAVQIPAEPIYAAAVSESVAAPTFPGPNIANITGTQGQAITPVDVHASFSSSVTLTYSASPAGTAWPSGIAPNASTSIISGSSATPAVTAGLKVRATDINGQFVDSNAFSLTIVALATTASASIYTDATTPAASLTGLKWAYRDSFLGPILASGSAGATNGAGLITVSITGTALPVGGVGWLEVTNSDGTIAGRSTAKAFSGPVTVA